MLSTKNFAVFPADFSAGKDRGLFAGGPEFRNFSHPIDDTAASRIVRLEEVFRRNNA
jgi:hypothetical protein